jgi:hypothetical protein
VYGRKLPVPAVSVRARHGVLACVLHAGGVSAMQVEGSRVEGELRLRVRRGNEAADVVARGETVQVNGRTLDDEAMTD